MLEEICRWFVVKSKHRVLDQNHLPTDREASVFNYVLPNWFSLPPPPDALRERQRQLNLSLLDYIADVLSSHAFW